MSDHHITPPPELVEQWRTAPEYANGKQMFEMVSVSTSRLQQIATQAARWGADTELNECCHLLRQQGFDVIEDLRAARRPKPPSLKEQALEALGPEPLPETGPTGDTILNCGAIERHRILRLALEQLND